MALLDFLFKPPDAGPLLRQASGYDKSGFGASALKAAFDLQPMGVQVGRPQYPDSDVPSLMTAYKRNEMVYAAIDIKATAAQDPRLIVQGRKAGGEWEEIIGHPLRRLLMRPNPYMDEAAFVRSFIVSRDVAGRFYAEKVRGPNGLPIELHPLNPSKVAVVPGAGGTVEGYEYREGTQKVFIKAEDMLAYRLWDPERRYGALSPLSVCLGSVDADSAQTDYMRAFFNNAGVPSGILTVKNRKLTQDAADEIRSKWQLKYGRAWGRMHDMAVLDEDASYQKLGANLNELESEALRSFTESRIAMVFKVPPLIIYSYTGLLRATYSNLKEAWRGFWDATLHPLFKDYRSWLTWSLLMDFATEDQVYGEQIQLGWDMSHVGALQEDVDSLHVRAERAFAAGGLTLNEYRGMIGEPEDPSGDYYLRHFNLVPHIAGEPIPPQPLPASPHPLPSTAPLASNTPTPPKALLPPPYAKSLQLKRAPSLAVIERRLERDMKVLLTKQYEAVAAALEAA